MSRKCEAAGNRRGIEACAPAIRTAAAPCLLCGPAPGWAQDAMPLGEVRVSEDRANDAVAQAPTRTPLDATQPTSVISGPFIRNNIPAQSDYGQIVGLAPSVFAIERTAPATPSPARSACAASRTGSTT